MLKVENLSFSYNKKEVVKNVSFDIKKGEFVGLIGPNGSGKSTVLKNIYRGLVPKNGKILLDNENILKMTYKKSARKMAVVSQEHEIFFDFKVEEIVAMGRSPHKKIFEIDDEKDKIIVKKALSQLGIEGLAKRNYKNLSGGEKQRTVIARAIAQEADFLILDEPTNHLDISYQMQMFEIVKSLDVTVLSAIHDLNLASLFCDRLIVMMDGEVVLEGTPKEVLNEKNIYDIYGVKADIKINENTDKPFISFLPKEHKLER